MIDLTAVRLERPRLAAPLLDGADLRVGHGEVVLITGTAGAGTSTLVDALLGEVAPSGGHVAVFGRDLKRLRRSSLLALRRRLGVIPQRLDLLPERTALDNVALPLEIDHVPRGEIAVRAALCLGRVGLATEIDRPLGELSLAQQQRVAVARALVRAPRLIVADQPTCHQDAAGTAVVADLLDDAAAEGAAVLVISRDPHLLQLAAERGWRQLRVTAGRLIEAGSPPVEAAPAEESVPIDIVVDEPAAEATASEPPPPGTIIPKVLPFPITSRSRGVG